MSILSFFSVRFLRTPYITTKGIRGLGKPKPDSNCTSAPADFTCLKEKKLSSSGKSRDSDGSGGGGSKNNSTLLQLLPTQPLSSHSLSFSLLLFIL